MSSQDSIEDILRELTDRATALWGEERAVAMRPELEQTARHLQEIGRGTPGRDVEPGFYQ